MTEAITIPGYSITGKLGQGGMATVYLAVQHSFERQVALKVMSPLLNSDPSFAARFKREARIVAQLSHASIVPVFDVGEHESGHYLSMEYLPGGDLKRRILDSRGDFGLALNVVTSLSAALDLAHRKGFVHRDIKPENILFREDGTPVLTDFGIARALDSGRSMTIAGMLVGTPDYMSPEQVKGLELDGRSDLYSLGIAFFEILTGAVPFKADSTLSVALKQVGEPMPPLPPEHGTYQEFLDCLTAKDRDERFASGAEVIRALRVIGTGRATRSRMSARSLAATDGTDTRIPTGLTSQPVSETYISQPTLARPRGVAEEIRRETLTEHLPKSVTNLPEPALISPEVERPAPVGVASRLGSRVAKIDRRMWMGAAGLLGLAVGVILIIGSLNAGPSSTMDMTPARVAQAAAVAATDADHQPTAATENPQPAATSLTPRSSPVSQANLSTTPTSNTPVPANIPTSSRVPTPPPAAQVAKSDDASATPAPENPDEGAEATARHKRMAEERHQRKVEAHLRAQQHADLQAVELQAARLQAQEVQIQQLLLEAKNEYAAGALWQPGGASAADRYREILKIQPGRAEALAGAQRVANVLAAEAARTESVGDADAARVLINALQSLQPSHPQLAQLQAGLQGLQSTPAVLDARDRARLEKAAGYIAQAYEYLGRTPLDFKAADAATEQYDKAQSAAAQAPGIPLLKERLIAAYADAARTALSQHDSKRALKLINSAHKRHWSSDELEQIEASLGPQVTTPTGPIKQAGATAAAAE